MWNRATQGGGNADYTRSIAMFELAKQAFIESGYTGPVALLDKKIELINNTMAGK